MKYSEYKPTVLDNHYEIEDREDWLVVPVVRSRDSRVIDISNFTVAAKRFGIDNIDDATIYVPGVEIHRFGHWGCGWFEILIVEPTDENEEEVDLIVESLSDYPISDYPILDETDYFGRKYVALQDLWSTLPGDEKAKYRYQDYKVYNAVPAVGSMAESFFEAMLGEV